MAGSSRLWIQNLGRRTIIAVLTFWNTLYLDKTANHLAKTSPLFDPGLLPFTSPLGWERIMLSGDVDWHSGAAERNIARTLHIKPTRNWGT